MRLTESVKGRILLAVLGYLAFVLPLSILIGIYIVSPWHIVLSLLLGIVYGYSAGGWSVEPETDRIRKR